MVTETKAYWSDCGSIFYLDGKGWGLTDTLQNIYLGKEDDIKKFLDTGELSNELNPMQRQVLVKIQEYRKEDGIGIREADLERANITRGSGHKPKAVRLPSARKGVSIPSPNKAIKSLSG